MNDPISPERWKDVLADAAAIADEYRSEGWEVLEVQPGSVSPAEKDERFGLSVLLPGNEYEAVEKLIEDDEIEFDGAEVYANEIGNTVYAMVVERDTATETAVVIPMAYSISDLQRVFERALETGHLELHLRPLTIEDWVTFVHDEPTLFFDPEKLETVIENDSQRNAKAMIEAAYEEESSAAGADESDEEYGSE